MGQLTRQQREDRNLQKLCTENLIPRVESDDISILKNEGMQLSLIRKHNLPALITELSAMIEGVFELVRVGKRIDEGAIIKLSKMILKKYWYLTIDEISYCLDGGIEGRYGKIYDRIDAQVILEWLHLYDTSDESIIYFEKQAEESNKPKGGRNKSLLDMPEFRERIKKDQNLRGHVEYSEEEKKAHEQMVRDQAKQIMNQGKN